MKITPMLSGPMSVSAQGNLNPQGAQVPHGASSSLRMNTNATPTQDMELLQPQDTNQTEVSAVTRPLSPQLALLAKQRRALQRERELLTREKAQLSQSQTSTVDVARLKSEPLQVLLDNGITYEQLTQAILSNQGNPEVNALKAEIQSLKEGVDKRFTDSEAQAERQVLMQMRNEALSLANNNPEYELINGTRSVPLVMQLIEKTYRSSGEVLDVPEAMQLIESELFKDAQKVARLKKMQSVYSPIPAQQNPQGQSQLRTPGMRTLTNRDTASPPLNRRARSLRAFYGQPIN